MAHITMTEDTRERIQVADSKITAKRLIKHAIDEAIDEIVYAFATSPRMEGSADEQAAELIAYFMARLQVADIADDLKTYWFEGHEDENENEAS